VNVKQLNFFNKSFGKKKESKTELRKKEKELKEPLIVVNKPVKE